ncbi:hypothetical protein [Photobacterium angustum]|uniref:hypothetical protein n=1 Tax=Photobacterium angustum TaxID=661 RepID=UPI000B14A286|nr:hypothetical protein [Photobacterium angustum]
MKNFLSAYGLWKGLVSIGFGVLLIFVDAIYFYKAVKLNGIGDKDTFMLIYINFGFLIILVLPWLLKKSENISNQVVSDFLDLPEKGQQIRFTDISTFLSDQALGAFLAGVLIFTGQIVASEYGAFLAGLYTLVLYTLSIGLVAISLIRFIYHFTKYSGIIYALAALVSTSIMFAFYHVGLKMAA